jgi:hypothetical protein
MDTKHSYLPQDSRRLDFIIWYKNATNVMVDFYWLPCDGQW